MKDLINSIIEEEWQQFQAVNNRGGRASCQDSPKEFYVMRYSQFASWEKTLLESYKEDLENASSNGRNLLFEKYAYMMEYTHPEEYREIAHVLPEIPHKKREIIEKITGIYLVWSEEFESEYPEFSSRGRRIYQDNSPMTSIETYLRGELCTYSEKTLGIYLDYVSECKRKGINLVTKTREITAKSYGYNSIEEAESA